MTGAILGDVIGSPFEFNPRKRKNFELFLPRFGKVCYCTDDSMMTLAVAGAILEAGTEDDELLSRTVVRYMQEIGRTHINAGYGGSFYRWLFAENPEPYNSFGNGAAMRVSPCAWAAETLEDARRLSDIVTRVTHNHPEGMKAARAVTDAIWMARHGSDKAEIREHIRANYYPLNRTLDKIRPGYHFDVTCQGSVPESIQCFLEAESFEDTVRNAVSLGGDADTQAAIAGSIAEAYFGIPEELAQKAEEYIIEADDYYHLPHDLLLIYLAFRNQYCS